MATGRDFLKKEPWYYRLLYLFGVIMLVIHLNYFLSEKENGGPHWVYPILGYGTLAVGMVRLAKFHIEEGDI